MAWKPKEKELTPEEAIALARKELEPFWFRSDPLVCGVKTAEHGAQAIPIDSAFSKGPWLIFFIDPSEFQGETVMHYAKEWSKRYSSHNLGFLTVFNPPYKFFRERKVINQFIEKMGLTFPMVVDADGLLFQAFRVSAVPKVMLIQTKGEAFEASGREWLEGTELKIQRALRVPDPGLPLSPPYVPQKAMPQDWFRFEFGSAAPADRTLQFPAPGFRATEENARLEGKFLGMKTDRQQANEVFLSGHWIQEVDHIVTRDPHATLGLTVPNGRFSLIAESPNVSDRLEPARVVVEIHDKPAYDAVAGEHLTLDESGQAVIKMRDANLYHVLQKLPAKDREVTLRFPTADRDPIALYGIRYGD